jgi:predicted metal-binding transcription factor (methanogenesis marker protein 9)
LEHVNPYDPENPNGNAEILPPPSNLQTQDGDKVIILTWDSVPGANGYQVYRDDKRIGETDTTYYMDTDLKYRTYEYQVATVHSSGLGGHKSDPVIGESKEGPKIPKIEYSRFEVYYGGNGDGDVNRGEELTVKIFLKNTGASMANSVVANLSENDPYVVVNDNRGDYGNMDPFEEIARSYSFKVSNDCPYGDVVTFFLNISDSEGNNWQDTFTVEVVRTKAVLEYSRFEVYYGGNSDDDVNRGEDLTVRIYLKNTGSSTANSVVANLNENDPYVVVNDNRGDYGNMDPFEEIARSYSFKVSNDCPYRDVVTFFLNISDSEGNNWQDTFTVEVVRTKAVLEYSQFEVYYGGNGDKKVNPGEDLTVRIYLKNTGSSMANSVVGYLSENDPYVDVNDNRGDYGNMDPFEDIAGSYSFKVSETTPKGHVINFSLDIQDEHGNSWEDSFTVTVE